MSTDQGRRCGRRFHQASRARVTSLALGVLSLVVLWLALGGALARALTFNSCDIGGKTYTFVGQDPTDASDWARAMNWDPSTGTPGPHDTAIIEARGGQVSVHNTPAAVCNLTLSSANNNSANLASKGLVVNGTLDWHGGNDFQRDASTITGPITVNGGATLSGKLQFNTTFAGVESLTDRRRRSQPRQWRGPRSHRWQRHADGRQRRSHDRNGHDLEQHQ